MLRNKNSVYYHTSFTHIYIIHIDIHTICGHRNGLPSFVRVLSEEESFGFWTLRENGYGYFADWQAANSRQMEQ